MIQFGGSLVAILIVVGIAYRLKLGPERRLDSEESARIAATEAVDGFDAIDISLDAEGRAALLRDASGCILLLRQHGTHFAGRVLTSAADARIDNDVLVIDTAERRYGAARLHVADASAWKQAIEAIE